MSVTNLDGDGYGDTSGLVYGYEAAATADSDVEIRKIIRSGYGEIGASLGDVQPMASTKSTLDTRLPALDFARTGGHAQPDCGKDLQRTRVRTRGYTVCVLYSRTPPAR